MPHARGSKASTKILATTTIWSLAMMIRRSAHLWPTYVSISKGLPGRHLPSILWMHENFSCIDLKRQRSQKNIHQLPWPKLLRRHANQRPHAKALVVDTEMRHIRKIVAELVACESFGKACEGSTNWLSRHSAFAGWMVDPGPWTMRFGPWNMDALTGSDMPKSRSLSSYSSEHHSACDGSSLSNFL